MRQEIERSAGKYAKEELPQFEAKAPPEPEPEQSKEPPNDPELSDDNLDDDEGPNDPPPEPDDPSLCFHGDPGAEPHKRWLIKHLIPEVGKGLLSGQWGAGKTFVALELAGSLMTGQPFLGHTVKRQCGVLFIAAERAGDVLLRLDTLLREKCGNMAPAPFAWSKTAPLLLHKGAVEKLIAKARQAERRFEKEFGLPLGLIVIDTLAACAGYHRAGDENDNAVGQAIMNVLEAVGQEIKCFAIGVAHFGRDQLAGTRGATSTESSADVVLACLGDKQVSGSVINTRLAIRKHSGGAQGQEHPFALRIVEAPEPDEDGDPITTMVVDWLPPGSAQAPLPPEDPWIKGCRRDQQAIMLRLKRVLMAVLAEHGIDRPIPSKVSVQSSDPPRKDQLWTPTLDAPVVRMVDQGIVREAFDLHTPQARQTRHERFKAARGPG